MQPDVIVPIAPTPPIRRPPGPRGTGAAPARIGGRPSGPAGLRPDERADGIAFVDWRATGSMDRGSQFVLPRDGLVLQIPLERRPGGVSHAAPERICTSAVTLLDIRALSVPRDRAGTVQIWLSSTVLGEVADSMGFADLDPMEALRPVHGSILVDPTIHDLVASAVATLDRPDRGAAIFRVQLARALAAHLLGVHAESGSAAAPTRGGLAPWQLRRAQERIRAGLGDAPNLPAVAAECGLSVSHFTRAFRRSVGTSPHVWLVRQRVARAKAMMRGRDRSLAEIALACGFADQSHFTRVFAREADISPGRWRRMAGPDRQMPVRDDAF
ncbi:MAG: AraC family transcriptional regulator [Methylobacterium sp.]|uniref:helix-turn-helix domain-containing protein n=1 Tax=Methylobacterium sp. TaxID=409 RepID=UPI00271A5BEB|nr:AraC family transcriptional regulator [Methylobacterium sp.]MDO9427825.1 AraC family transcriptional regulator [Methylobacterium sp.]